MSVVDLNEMHAKKSARRCRRKKVTRKAAIVPKRSYVRPADKRSFLNIYAWIVREAQFKVDKHDLIRVVTANATTVVPRVRQVLDLMIADGMVTEDHFGHCMASDVAYLSILHGRSFKANLVGLKSMLMIRRTKKLIKMLEQSVESLIENGHGCLDGDRIVPTPTAMKELTKRLGE